MGALTLQSSSAMRLGTNTATLTFASGSYTAGTLTISNWTGTAGVSGTANKIFITAAPSATFLTNITFAGYSTGAIRLGTGEIVPSGSLSPTKLAITSVNSGSSPVAGSTFSVVIQSQNAGGTPANVVTDTAVTLSLNTGSGSLGGTLTGTITAGMSSLTISGVTYGKAESGVILTATRTSGDSLTAGNSSSFIVNPGAFTRLQLLVPGETASPGSGTGKTGTPTAQTSGSAFNVTVNSVDANWNLISTNHTVNITSSDGGATLPANAALVAGTKSFSVTLNTVGSATVTASNVTQVGITANTSPSITVSSANISLNATDALGTSSFNSGLNWVGGAAPVAGNAYLTAAFLLRTPQAAANYTFAGNSLEIQSGGSLRHKTIGTITINNLILQNTAILELTRPNDVNNATAAGTLAGNITLNGTATIRAGISGDVAGETLTISSTISGTGGFTTTGSTGKIILTGANTYTGGTTIVDGSLALGTSNVLANTGALTLDGGTFSSQGYNETLGALTNKSSSTLVLGTNTTGTLTFASGSYTAGTLTISNWTGTGGVSGTANKIFITAAPSSTFLSRITFVGYQPGAIHLGTGEIVPKFVGWYAASWTNRLAITIDYTKVSGNQTNFPVLINLTNASLQASALASGYDLLFTSADGTNKLDHEIESYTNSNGALVAWVEVPVLSSTEDTILYLYYGNAAAANQQNVAGTWNSNFKAVWHLKETSGSFNDSTANANNGTDAVSATGKTGRIGSGQQFNGTNDYINAGTFDPSTADLTISFWAKWSGANGRHQTLIAKRDTWSGTDMRWQLARDVSIPDLRFNTPAAAALFNVDVPDSTTWHSYVVTRSGTSCTLYKDGVAYGNTATLASYSSDTAAKVLIGGVTDATEGWNGNLDEVRLVNVASSASWIATEYTNQNSPATFYSVSSVESAPATTLAVTSINGGTSPTAGNAFSVVVQSQDSLGIARNVAANTAVTLSLNTGSGTLSGTLTGTITAGTSSVTFSGIAYNKVENGVVLTVTRTSGDVLTATNSSPFNVMTVRTVGNLIANLRSFDLHTNSAIVTWTNRTASSSSVGNFTKTNGASLVVARLPYGSTNIYALSVNNITSNAVISSLTVPVEIATNGSVSVEAWVYAYDWHFSSGNASAAVGYGNNNVNNADRMFQYDFWNTQWRAFAGQFNDLAIISNSVSGPSLTSNAWHHVVWVYNGTN
ncbi:MAG: LamG domain-containing protein, partial [Akkermansiaceae bacterium]|nr:LamG domain-containing protein [Verrucomicrobiales bacterium]